MAVPFGLTLKCSAEDETQALFAVLTWNNMHKGLLDKALDMLSSLASREWLRSHQSAWWARAKYDESAPTKFVIGIGFKVEADMYEFAETLKVAA